MMALGILDMMGGISMKDLKQCRIEIDEIDQQLMELLKKECLFQKVLLNIK